MKTIKFSALVASIFSVLFSLSLVREMLRLDINFHVIIFLSSFLLLFLIWNEYSKVRELMRKFTPNKTYSVFVLLITFVVSISMSGVGVWFWVDNSLKNKETHINQTIQLKDSLYNEYKQREATIQDDTYHEDPEYQRLNQSLKYWTNRGAMDLDDLRLIRSEISNIEKRINSIIENHSKEKQRQLDELNDWRRAQEERISDNTIIESKTARNSIVTYIFFILILITEFSIVSIRKELCYKQNSPIHREAKLAMQAITFLKYRYPDKVIGINELKFSPIMKGKDWELVKKIWNMYKDIGAIQSEQVSEDSVKKIKRFYKKVLILT